MPQRTKAVPRPPLKRPLKLFVSSTWRDLRPERAAAVSTLTRLGKRLPIPVEVIGMEDFGSRPENTTRTSLDEVGITHLYVGIIGERYGSGITEREYEKASERGMRCFIYFKRVASRRVGRKRLIAFKERLRREHTCTEFSSPHGLAVRLRRDILRHFERCLPEYRISSPGSSPYTIKVPPLDFVGRREEVETLRQALKPASRARVALLHGMSGVGKTALALRVAESLRDHYPETQLFIRLGDANDAPFGLHVALLNCITQLGGEARVRDDLETLAGTYRRCLRGRRALIVLDDAVSETQIGPFVPPAGCALLVTSRENLLAPDAGATPLRLGLFGDAEAQELLTKIEPRLDADTAGRLARLCGHLPLALRAAGSHLALAPDLDPDDYLKELRRERTRLQALGERGVAVGVEASFNLSYDRLPEGAQCAFRRLAVFPASFDAQAGRQVIKDAACPQLSNLVRHGLISYDDGAKRYHLHDLLRIYAGRRLPDAERQLAERRHAVHFLGVAQRASRLRQRTRTLADEGVRICDAEWENFRVGLEWTRRRGDKEAKQMCVAYVDALKDTLRWRRHPKEQAAWFAAALAASRRLRSRAATLHYLRDLGAAYISIDAERAAEFCRRSLRLARKAGDRVAEANALGALGNTYVSAGRIAWAVKYYGRCLSILCQEGEDAGVVSTLNNLGIVHSRLGRSHDAVKYYRHAAQGARALADPRTELIALTNLGDELITLGEAKPAFKHYERAMKLAVKVGDRRGEACAVSGLGNAHAALKQHERALELHRLALDISRDLEDSVGVMTALGNMGNAYAGLRETDEAVPLHRESLLAARRLRDRAAVVRGLGNLGHTYYLTGDFRRAFHLHLRALRLARRLANPAYEAVARWNIAQVCEKQGASSAAKKHAISAHKIFKRLRHPLADEVREFFQTGAEEICPARAGTRGHDRVAHLSLPS